MSPIGMVGWGAVGVVVVLWLLVSFSAPSPRRTLLEWLGATALYVALAMLFLNLVLRARAADNTFAVVAFGFLLAIFAIGFCVSLFSSVRALAGGEGKQASSATN